MTNKKTYIFPLTIIAFIFFVFGFIIWLNGILIPYFKICLELTNFQASLVVFAAYIAYFFMAIPSAWVLKHIGYKRGMVLGLSVMAFGTILFLPAAYTRTYILFLSGLFITGTGLTLLQASVNPYVAVIGPIESTAQRVGFLGLANKIAGIFSITVLGSVFLINADDIIARVSVADIAEKAIILDEYALKIVGPYIIITLVLLSMGVLIFFSNMPEIDESKIEVNGVSQEIAPRSSIFQYPWLILGVISMFFAISCEIIPVDGIIIYSKSLGISIEEARHFPTYTLVAMLMGYLASIILIPKYLSQNMALKFAAFWGIIFSLFSFFGEGMFSIFCLILTGFATAMLWGTIWGLSLKNLGKYTKIGGAMLLMGIIGGAVLPVIFGRLIDYNPLFPQNAVLLLIPFYLVLIAFATWGYRLEKWSVPAFKKALFPERNIF
jgi:FHS family L-fucose permease-like MFS transporter